MNLLLFLLLLSSKEVFPSKVLPSKEDQEKLPSKEDFLSKEEEKEQEQC